MNTKIAETLKKLSKHPVKANIQWSDVVYRLIALGSEIINDRGSKVHIVLNGTRIVFHSPHPHKEMRKDAITSMQKFLLAANIFPNSQ